ncbi:MAG: phosphoribosyltransferase [Patescibacteria group bacterium]|nr:phosphoribosyltransferase [Patescibacteria group bacterium]
MFIRRIIELMTPTRCLGCDRDGEVLCGDCTKEMAFSRRNTCFRCNLASPAGGTCGSCRAFTPLAGVAVGAHYAGSAKELVLALKFQRLRAAARAAALLVAQGLPEGLAADVVTAVPISASRYRERGYNQAELVARQLAHRLGLPYSALLGRTNSVHQLGLDRQTRLEQIKGAFYPVRRLEGRRVLVVDDVLTTGATLSECAQTLAAAGAESVWGAVVAKH